MIEIELVVLETDRREEELFLILVFRGRHADTPFYYSVESYDWKKGTVIFTRLDCAPAPSFKVGIAGNKIIVSQRDIRSVESWLSEAGISFEVGQRKEFSEPAEAQTFLADLRKRVSIDRGTVGKEVAEKIKEFNQGADQELLALS